MLKNNIKSIIRNVMDKREHFHAIRNEHRKYQDPRRKKIVDSVILTQEQKEQVDDVYETYYGEKIPLTWHKSYTSHTGKFDPYYIPETLYIPEFEKYMNFNNDLANVLEDKNLLYTFASAAGVRMPKKYLACQYGIYSDSNNDIVTLENAVSLIANIGDCFIKPSIGTDSGQGCEVFTFRNGMDITSGESCSSIIARFGNNFTVQERLKCHESITRIYDGSVNTFRIMTYRWKDAFYYAPVIMRIGRGGSYLDNAHAGGIFIALSNNGALHRTAITEFGESFDSHPDSNLVFSGYKIELLPKVVDTALKMHKTIPSIGVINWDMTLDEDGNPILIEANVKGGSIWLFQMAHGCGVFENNTLEILQWIRKMKALKVEERKNHYFGQ